MSITTSDSPYAHGALHNLGVNLVPIDGELYLIRQFYRLPESEHLFARLESGLA